MGVMIGAPSATTQVNNIANSIANQTIPEKTGIIQYANPNILTGCVKWREVVLCEDEKGEKGEKRREQNNGDGILL